LSILRNLFQGIFASRRDPKPDPEESASRGWAAVRAGRAGEAERIADAVIAGGRLPDGARGSVHWLRALARARQRKFVDALADYDIALERLPDSVQCRLDHCAALHVLGRFEEALGTLNAALKIDPKHKVALHNRGLVLRELARLDEAEASIRTALECDGDYHDARASLTMILIEQGRLDEAAREVDIVAAAEPQHAQLRWNRAVLLLLRGQFAAGWRDYECRLERPEHYPRPYRFPRWDGQPLAGASLLITAEQGLGDEILFASCFNEAIERARHCVIECEPRLQALFQRSFPSARVVGAKLESEPGWLKDAADVAAQIPAGSLPRMFRNDVTQFPAHRGYLAADPASVAAWRARLDRLGSGMKVGIAWTGGAMKTRRRTRSVALAEWLPILRVPGTHWVSLQYMDSGAEIEQLAATHGIEVHDWLERGADYDETASLVAALDLVITVTTALVHLAGALGKSVWVLVPANPEWRYMESGTTSPWYPSARLFRQSRLSDWSPVIDEVAAALSSAASRQDARKSPT
jgi:tetratricopeptide (TPR) repeat protein